MKVLPWTRHTDAEEGPLRVRPHEPHAEAHQHGEQDGEEACQGGRAGTAEDGWAETCPWSHYCAPTFEERGAKKWKSEKYGTKNTVKQKKAKLLGCPGCRQPRRLNKNMLFRYIYILEAFCSNFWEQKKWGKRQNVYRFEMWNYQSRNHLLAKLKKVAEKKRRKETN